MIVIPVDLAAARCILLALNYKPVTIIRTQKVTLRFGTASPLLRLSRLFC
jgi:hypothetical protein